MSSKNKSATRRTYDNAVVVRVRIKKARASMKDELLSDEVCKRYGIDPSRARVSKDIFKMPDINRPITAARAYLREHGVPWSATTEDEDGKKKQDATWVFNGRDVKSMADFMRSSKEEFEGAVQKMADDWDGVVAEIRRELGGAFNQGDLPTREEFLSQFKWETEITPLMDLDKIEEDFRLISLPEEIINEQLAQHRRQLGEKIDGVVRDMFKRVQTEIMGDARDKGLLAGLEEYDPDPDDKRKGNTFRDARLYGNMNEWRDFAHGVAEIFPEAPGLKELCDRLDTFCDKILPTDPEVVRTDDVVRKRVIQGLEGILNPSKMPETDDDGNAASTGKDSTVGGFAQFV